MSVPPAPPAPSAPPELPPELATQPPAQVPAALNPGEGPGDEPAHAPPLEATPPPAHAPGMGPAQAWAALQQRFPALFAAAQVLPMKLRIHADIQARAPGVFSRRVLGAVLSRHTTSTAYLKALVRSPHRFDLDGQVAGEVEAAHRQAAQEELARRLPRPRPQPKAPSRPPAVSTAPRQQPPRASRPPGASPDDEAARLLKAFHSTALSKTNFCALQGITVETLEAALGAGGRSTPPSRSPQR